MENHEYKILSEDSIKYLCGLIRDLASVSEGIDNINLADDKTFSNIYIKNLIDKCLEDANAEAEKLVGALTHLTCKETAIQPTLDNSEINIIYLYSANGNPPYQQFLKISEDKLVDLGSTSISLEDYIKVADVAKDYATKVELKSVTDKIGTTTLMTTDKTLSGAIEELHTNISDHSSDNVIHITQEERDKLITTDDVVKRIDSTNTDLQVPTAKAVNDKFNSILGDTDISSIGDGTVTGAISEINNLSGMQTANLTWKGLKLSFYKQGRFVYVKVSGTITEDLLINNSYTDTITVPAGFEPHTSDIGYYMSGQNRFQFNTLTTGLRFGYNILLSTGEKADIKSGTEFWFNRTYISAV